MSQNVYADGTILTDACHSAVFSAGPGFSLFRNPDSLVVSYAVGASCDKLKLTWFAHAQKCRDCSTPDECANGLS